MEDTGHAVIHARHLTARVDLGAQINFLLSSNTDLGKRFSIRLIRDTLVTVEPRASAMEGPRGYRELMNDITSKKRCTRDKASG